MLVWRTVISIKYILYSDSLGIKMVVKMLSHFGFEKANSEPEISSYPPDLDFGGA